MADEYLITVTRNDGPMQPLPDQNTAQQDLINALAIWALVNFGQEFPSFQTSVSVPQSLAVKICRELGHLVFRVLPSVVVLKHHIEAERKGH